MKRIERRSLVAGIFRVFFVTGAVLMLCQFQAKQVRAQAILPLVVEQLAQQGEDVESPPPFRISNLNNRLAALWKADFSVNQGQEKARPTAAESDSGEDPAEKRKSTALPNPAIAPADIDRAWVSEHHRGSALLHRVDPRSGLTEADLAQIGDWLSGCSQLSAE